ncbi:uncharacterized protein LOC122667342 [Telopea speciosissima]|uniref:uncharacterized protein LOC122667342 n=1 Tax=Telopea speciosissima TaxID=54955 RepID=UPI001CC4538A|nr:uncharacterized protein LOC122667342 [Telopea speciosissima]
MAASQDHSSLNCELRIIEAKNIKSISTATLFVRYFFCAGNNETIRLNSREIPWTSHPYWNESFSLECSATKDCLEELKKQSVVFELRWRDKTPILGKFRRSKLLGIAEIRWKEVLESSELAIDTWINTVATSSNNSPVLKDLTPPSLHVQMKVRIPATMETVKQRRCVCGCGQEFCECDDDDLFALAAWATSSGALEGE